MNMIYILPFFLLWPLLGFLISLLIPGKNEVAHSRWSVTTVLVQLFAAGFFIVKWIIDGAPMVNVKEVTIYQAHGYEFYIDLFFDRLTAVYLLLGAVLTLLITIYSRHYLHRESGYKRFFNTIMFFYLGFNIIIFSGNFETMFIGWEVLGISSFLLIAFYRDRYLPVKNAVKVFSIYRIGDVGMLLAMWLSHHLWHENVTFIKLHNQELVHEHLLGHSAYGIFIASMLLLAAAVKSAQFPFSSWLPRAMEGPTPSSAIFYGSLSVHIGVFLMMRTFPFWENQWAIRIALGVMGAVTGFIAFHTARVQSSIKAQIAYASISQIGIIFIEIALGWQLLALVHTVGNAFLRTYQLLVSPSVVTYLIREQFYNLAPHRKSGEENWPAKVRNTIYMLSLKEWNLDSYLHDFLWRPTKRLGQLVGFLNRKSILLYFLPVYLIGCFFYWNQGSLPSVLRSQLPVVFSLIGLVLVLRAFTERKSARLTVLLVTLNHFWIALAVSFNEMFSMEENVIYLSGVLVSGVVGYFAIRRLVRLEGSVHLQDFQGHVYEHPKIAMVFLLACLGLAGFPITTAFLGEDLILSHIHGDQIWLAGSISLSLIVDGLALIRLYARIFLGPHIKSYHEKAHRSS
ncbi:MAG: hypothetical protein RL226_1011 [Bacteroidota bacterium]